MGILLSSSRHGSGSDPSFDEATLALLALLTALLPSAGLILLRSLAFENCKRIRLPLFVSRCEIMFGEAAVWWRNFVGTGMQRAIEAYAWRLD